MKFVDDMKWLHPELQKRVEYRDGDTIISVPGKSGTTWTMNIFHQLRTGGDPDFADIYAEVPWVEFKERPDQTDEELLERWKSMPHGVPRGFKSHASPGPFMDYQPNLKYVVVFRNPEEATVSFFPFMHQHSDELWELWDADDMKKAFLKPTFPEWFHEVFMHLPPNVPGGLLNVWFSGFINGWWPKRHESNVLMIHFTDMKKDHLGTIRKIGDFLGLSEKLSEEQWSNVAKYTSFAWMKEHEEKFEAATVGPVPVLKRGAMIRKGITSAQAEDGMTPEISVKIRDWIEKNVEHPDAIKWMYEGGVLP